MMLNKTFYLLLLSLIPLLGFSQANSQYPDSGNKIRLGFQTTGDGLIWRDTQPKAGGYQPINNKAAWIILDTMNNKFYHYKNSTWTLAGGQDIDTANLIATKYDLGFKLSLADTGNMLTPYLRKLDTTSIAYVNTYGTQTVNGAKTLTSNLILKNSQEPSRATVVATQTFAADTTNWTRGTGWTFNGTQAVATAATGDLTYTPALTITSGNAYEITYTVTNYLAGTLTVRIGNVSLALPTHNATANVILLLPTSATGGFRFTTSLFTGNIDNVSVVEISNAASVLFSGQDDGSAALYSSLVMPNSSSIAFGGGERFTTGINNVANGINALIVNTTGFGNIANGTNALLNNTTGNNNVSNGTNALRNNTTGFSNMANGLQSLFSNTIGSNNVGVGVNSLASNTIGSNNVAIGNSALYNTLSFGALAGSSNIGIGSFAGDNIYGSAFGNVAIGNSIDFPDSIGSNQVVIKNIIFATGASGTGTTIAGSVGIGTNAPTARLHVKGVDVTDSNFALKVEDSNNLNLLSVKNNGDVTLKNPLSVANGGTGSTTQNFLDLTTTQSVGGAKTFTSSVTGASFIPTSSTIPSNGLYLSGTNQTSISSNSIEILRVAPGRLQIQSGYEIRFMNSLNNDWGLIKFGTGGLDLALIRVQNAGGVNSVFPIINNTTDLGRSSFTFKKGWFTNAYIDTLGIGETTPTQKLHVVGNARITGNIGAGIDVAEARLHVKGSTNASEFALKVDDSGGTNLLSVQNNGDVTLKNPLSVANGGTGQSTTTNALNALLPSQSQTTTIGATLKSNGTNVFWDNFSSTGTVQDQSGNFYNTVAIGTQIWFKENLRTKKYRNGNNITIKTNTDTSSLEGQMYYYNNDSLTNYPIYGALYNWKATQVSDSLCPVGWHVPTDAEWTTLSNFLISNQGAKLKATTLNYWNSPNTGATNEFGFTGLPGGYRFEGLFSEIKSVAFFWTSSEGDTVADGRYRRLISNGTTFSRLSINKTVGASVRCLKN